MLLPKQLCRALLAPQSTSLSAGDRCRAQASIALANNGELQDATRKGSFDVRAYPRTLAEALEKLGGATMDPTGTDQAADGLRAGAASHDAYEAVTSGVENVISVTGKPGRVTRLSKGQNGCKMSNDMLLLHLLLCGGHSAMVLDFSGDLNGYLRHILSNEGAAGCFPKGAEKRLRVHEFTSEKDVDKYKPDPAPTGAYSKCLTSWVLPNKYTDADVLMGLDPGLTQARVLSQQERAQGQQLVAIVNGSTTLCADDEPGKGGASTMPFRVAVAALKAMGYQVIVLMQEGGLMLAQLCVELALLLCKPAGGEDLRALVEDALPTYPGVKHAIGQLYRIWVRDNPGVVSLGQLCQQYKVFKIVYEDDRAAWTTQRYSLVNTEYDKLVKVYARMVSMTKGTHRMSYNSIPARWDSTVLHTLEQSPQARAVIKRRAQVVGGEDWWTVAMQEDTAFGTLNVMDLSRWHAKGPATKADMLRMQGQVDLQGLWVDKVLSVAEPVPVQQPAAAAPAAVGEAAAEAVVPQEPAAVGAAAAAAAVGAAAPLDAAAAAAGAGAGAAAGGLHVVKGALLSAAQQLWARRQGAPFVTDSKVPINVAVGVVERALDRLPAAYKVGLAAQLRSLLRAPQQILDISSQVASPGKAAHTLMQALSGGVAVHACTLLAQH